MHKYSILLNSISQQDKYCEGIWSGQKTNNYILGVYLILAKTKIKFSHVGSSILDKICCFDLAEVIDANLGQINMIEVSSFCGPSGIIWGYDICKNDKRLFNPKISVNHDSIPVYNINTLIEAFRKLLGSVDSPRFPFLPGAHIPCATKKIICPGPCHIYAAKGVGIPKNREYNACLLMEDAGKIPQNTQNVVEYKIEILKKLVASILQIGHNQKIQYKEIFIGINDIMVGEDEFGCAMAISPYFTLAKDAISKTQDMFEQDIYSWENEIKNNFIYNNGLS